MVQKEQLENIKTREKFLAFNKYNELCRCMKEEETVFVYAKGRKHYGWRLSNADFMNGYTLKESKTTPNEQWKKRLKRAIKCMDESGLWANIKEVYENLFNYVSLEDKNAIYSSLDWNDTEEERQAKVEQVKAKYPFMIRTDKDGKEYIDSDYIYELSDCKLKSMYFGWNNQNIKERIQKDIETKTDCHYAERVNYDVSFSYDAENKKAWYSEEYRDCGNGHYYLALNNSVAVFCEND